MLSGADCVLHAMRVSGGLESLVVGEGQILAQLKQCHLHGSWAGAEGDPKAGGKVLSRMLANAVRAGKRVRTETNIAKGSVSISSAAVEMAELMSLEALKMPFSEARLAVVGSGKMTKLLVSHLASKGVTTITIVNRSLEKPLALAALNPSVSIDARLVTDLWDVVQRSDVVFVATTSPDYIFTPSSLASGSALSSESDGTSHRRLMLVDISVPRNVAPECAAVPGVKSYNVDDLKAVVARNTAARMKEVVEAEELLREESESFVAWRESLGAVPTINMLREKADRLRAAELDKCVKKLGGLNESQIDAVERLSKGIVNKILHGPMAHLRKTEGIVEKKTALKEIQHMFELEA
jgi:glutamyl-tRNA reductase